MLKNHNKEITIFHKLVDLIIVSCSWLVSYYLRYETGLSGASEGMEGLYFKHGLILLLISYYNFRRHGLYFSQRFSGLSKEILAVVRANTIACLIFVLFVYFMSDNKVSRAVLIQYYLLSTTFLVGFKVILRKSLSHLRSKGKNLRYMLLVGSSPQLLRFANKIINEPDLGVVVRGWADSDGLSQKLGITEVSNLKEALDSDAGVDTVVIGYLIKDAIKQEQTLKFLGKSMIDVTLIPDLSYSLVGYSISDFQGTPTIHLNEPNFKSRSIITKRLFDIVLSLLGMILISPLLLTISLLVKITSRGPIFYSQVRMGLDGKKFKMYKFRSMRPAPPSEQGWTIKNDPRVTGIGKILRKTSLDELPQLWNVVKGDMSLVGPRPERPQYVHEFSEKIPNYMLRHKMKAGITGWAQINGWRGDTSIEKRIECDLYYIKNWSMWMDFTILIMTFWKGFFNKNAY